jgi:beta-galactosidase/beta-glucuronidase
MMDSQDGKGSVTCGISRHFAHPVQVQAEVLAQASRLANHASIVLWGGNNEVEQSLGWYPEVQRRLHQFREDYTLLFMQVIPEVLHSVYAASAPSVQHLCSLCPDTGQLNPGCLSRGQMV